MYQISGRPPPKSRLHESAACLFVSPSMAEVAGIFSVTGALEAHAKIAALSERYGAAAAVAAAAVAAAAVAAPAAAVLKKIQAQFSRRRRESKSRVRLRRRLSMIFGGQREGEEAPTKRTQRARRHQSTTQLHPCRSPSSLLYPSLRVEADTISMPGALSLLLPYTPTFPAASVRALCLSRRASQEKNRARREGRKEGRKEGRLPGDGDCAKQME